MKSQLLHIHLLGRFRVRRDESDVPAAAFGGRLARTLVRLLVTRRGQLVPNDVLIEALWPDHRPKDPSGNLKILASRARHALGDASLISGGAGGYCFAGDDRCSVDAELFEARVQEGRRHSAAGRHSRAYESYVAALAEWRGDPLPEDAYADWAQDYRRELFSGYLDALEGGAAAALAAGDAAGAVALAQRAAALEPLRDAAHMLLMEALTRAGDAAAALAVFDSLRRRLIDELGTDPSPATAELYEEILRARIAPVAPVRRLSGAPPPPVTQMTFVGRDEELARVLRTLVDGGILVIVGHAGAGKTRLMAEAEARRPVPILAAKAFRPEIGRPWSLMRGLLREAVLADVDAGSDLSEPEAAALAAIVPELKPPNGMDPPADPETRRALAVQGAVKLIASASPPAVFADDIQWADSISLLVLQRALDRVPGLRLVVAYRPEEVDPGGAVDLFLAALRTRSVTPVELSALSAGAVEDLIDEPGLARIIAAETDGLPLSLTAVFESLVDKGVIEPVEKGRWHAPSSFDRRLVTRIARSGQERAIEVRVETLPPQRRDLLRLLALLGREVPTRMLVEATGWAETLVVGALDGLARANLVHLGQRGWTVAHDAVGDTIARGLSHEEAGLLHARLAPALAGDDDTDPAELASHLLRAGDTQAAAAAWASAAHARLDRFSNEEALRLADEGLRLEPTVAIRRSLLDARSEARRRTGDLSGARDDLRTIVSDMASGPARSIVMSRMAMLDSGADDYVQAGQLTGAAVVEAGTDDKALAEAFFVQAVIAMNTGDFAQTDEKLTAAMSLFERSHDAEGTARILDLRGMTDVLAARLPEAVDELDSAARLFLDSGNLLRAIMPRAVRGAVLSGLGRAADAAASVDEAVASARSLGQLEDEAFALIARAVVLSNAGRHDEALASAQQALEIAERLSHREWICHALWVLGGIQLDTGNLAGAETSLRRALELAAHLPLHASYAAGKLARVLIRRGELDEAEVLVDRAVAESLPVSKFDVDLARAELAVAKRAPDASAIVVDALAFAESAGYRVSVPRLRELAHAASLHRDVRSGD